MDLTADILKSYPGWNQEIDKFVQQSGGNSSAVYKVTTPDGSTRYVRTLTEDRANDIRRGTATNELIGLPEHCILNGDPPVLVMKPAPGRPLSRLLVVMTAPIVWRSKAQSMMSAFHTVGKQLGRLHAITIQGECPAIETISFNRYLSSFQTIQDEFDEINSGEFENMESRLRSVTLQTARIFSDRTPHNIYFNGEDVTQIDFTLTVDAVIQELLIVERGIDLAVYRLPHGRSNQSDCLIKAFRTGYAAERPDYERPDETGDLQCVMDWYLLSWYRSNENHKLGAKLTRRADISRLQSRIRSALHG